MRGNGTEEEDERPLQTPILGNCGLNRAAVAVLRKAGLRFLFRVTYCWL